MRVGAPTALAWAALAGSALAACGGGARIADDVIAACAPDGALAACEAQRRAHGGVGALVQVAEGGLTAIGIDYASVVDRSEDLTAPLPTTRYARDHEILADARVDMNAVVKFLETKLGPARIGAPRGTKAILDGPFWTTGEGTWTVEALAVHWYSPLYEVGPTEAKVRFDKTPTVKHDAALWREVARFVLAK